MTVRARRVPDASAACGARSRPGARLRAPRQRLRRSGVPRGGATARPAARTLRQSPRAAAPGGQGGPAAAAPGEHRAVARPCRPRVAASGACALGRARGGRAARRRARRSPRRGPGGGRGSTPRARRTRRTRSTGGSSSRRACRRSAPCSDVVRLARVDRAHVGDVEHDAEPVEVGVQAVAGELDDLERLLDALHREVLRLGGQQRVVGGDERVDGQQAERRRAVEQDDVVVVARRRLQRALERQLAAHLARRAPARPRRARGSPG